MLLLLLIQLKKLQMIMKQLNANALKTLQWDSVVNEVTFILSSLNQNNKTAILVSQIQTHPGSAPFFL